MVKGTINVKLNIPVEYALGGSIAYADEFVLKAPTMKHSSDACVLKQMYSSSMIKDTAQLLKDGGIASSEEKKAEDKDKFTMEEVRGSFAMMSWDLQKASEVFKKLILQDLCYINDTEKTRVTNNIFDNVDLNDGITLMAAYIANFLFTLR